jgi:preprotein translocase subunit YajC
MEKIGEPFGKSVVSMLVLLMMVSFSAFGQENRDMVTLLDDSLNKMVRVETIGGGTFQGELLKVQEDRIELLNGDGIILQISRKEIKGVVEINPEKGENLYFQDASANRLIVIPTGFGMEEKEFHIADIEILGITSSYGLSRNFSVWAGVSIPGAVFNARFSFTLADDFIGASVGSFVGLNWLGPLYSLFIPYLITSFGSENRNITVGAGGVFLLTTSPSSSFDFVSLAAVIGGKFPLSSTAALITENWIILPYSMTAFADTAMLFPAVAFRIAGNRLSWDIGVTVPVTVGVSGIQSLFGQYYIPIPILSLTYRIN